LADCKLHMFLLEPPSLLKWWGLPIFPLYLRLYNMKKINFCNCCEKEKPLIKSETGTYCEECTEDIEWNMKHHDSIFNLIGEIETLLEYNLVKILFDSIKSWDFSILKKRNSEIRIKTYLFHRHDGESHQYSYEKAYIFDPIKDWKEVFRLSRKKRDLPDFHSLN